MGELAGQGAAGQFAGSTRYTVNGVTYYNTSFNQVDLKFHIHYFPLAFMGLGLAFNSVLFSEYGNEMSRRFQLSVPANPEEKWISKLILSLLIYPIIFLTLYQLFALLTYQWGIARGYDYVKLHLFDPYIWKNLWMYWLWGGFLIGIATYYRKLSIVKIGLFLIGVYFAIGILMNIIVLIIFPDFDMSLMSHYFSPSGYQSYIFSNHHILSEGYMPIEGILGHPLFLTAAAIASLLYSYFKFYQLEG